jgi:hypothetical protein
LEKYSVILKEIKIHLVKYLDLEKVKVMGSEMGKLKDLMIRLG